MKKPTHLKLSFLENVYSVLSSKVLMTLCSLMTGAILARGLGVEDRGILAGIVIFPQLFTSLFEGGVRQSAMHFLGKGIISEAKTLGGIYILWLLTGVVSFFSCLLIMYYGVSNVSMLILCFAALIIPFDILAAYIRGFFLGKELYSSFNLVLVASKFLLLSFVCILYLANHLTVYNVVIVMSGVSLLTAGLSNIIIYLKHSMCVEFCLSTAITMFKKGLVYAIALFFIVANYKIDLLLLSQLGTDADTGAYVVAAQVGEALWQLPGAVVVVLMARSANASMRDGFSYVTAKTCRLTILVTLFCALGLYITSNFLIEHVYGVEFLISSSILVYLLPGLIVMVIFKVLNADYAGNGMPQKSLFVMVPAVLLNIILNLIFIPKFGAIGAAVASSISYLFASLVMIIMYSRDHQIGVSTFLIPKTSDFRV